MYQSMIKYKKKQNSKNSTIGIFFSFVIADFHSQVNFYTCFLNIERNDKINLGLKRFFQRLLKSLKDCIHNCVCVFTMCVFK